MRIQNAKRQHSNLENGIPLNNGKISTKLNGFLSNKLYIYYKHIYHELRFHSVNKNSIFSFKQTNITERLIFN